MKDYQTQLLWAEEFAKLLFEKKAAYPELKKARDEMKELLTVKANVERMLGEDEQKKENEKEQTTENCKENPSTVL